MAAISLSSSSSSTSTTTSTTTYTSASPHPAPPLLPPLAPPPSSVPHPQYQHQQYYYYEQQPPPPHPPPPPPPPPQYPHQPLQLHQQQPQPLLHPPHRQLQQLPIHPSPHPAAHPPRPPPRSSTSSQPHHPHPHHHQLQHHPQHQHHQYPAGHPYSVAPAASSAPPQTILPPIQHFDLPSHIMQPHSQYHDSAAYYPAQHAFHNGPMATQHMSSATGMPMAISANSAAAVMMRMPPQPTMPSPGGVRKAGKEIKRRTKTGCLTCRKRRIKCDEAHPTCRNCVKSKRECLGYDPIFKQQPGPAPIQPAPVGPNGADPYGAHAFPGPGGVYITGTNGAFEYGASLDPALGGGDLAPSIPQSHGMSLQPTRSVKPISMDQLFSLQNVPPHFERRDVAPPLTPAMQQEVQDFYRHHYASGLDKVFETSWYTTRGFTHLQEDLLLRDFVAQCSEQFKARGSDPDLLRSIQSLEARLVWLLATMPRSVSQIGNASTEEVPPGLLARIDTIENLLTGQFLPTNQIPPPPQTDDVQTQQYDEFSFWHHLGRFTAARDNTPDAEVLRDIEESLTGMRASLNLIESRDVLYSVAVARHFGGRMLDFNGQRHLFRIIPNSDDNVSKLSIAADFIVSQDQRGTTQIVQTICRMAIRSWALQKQ